MPDYARGKVYKITSGDLTYVGSTCEPTLARRLANHVSDYKRWNTGKGNKVITSFQVLERGDHEITLIELCPCQSRDELTARERHWVETLQCVNRCLPGRTRKEYNETHKEQINEYQKKYQKIYNEDHIEYHKEQCRAYYQANKEKINQATKERRAEKSKLILE